MDITFTPQEQAFRTEVREFLKHALPSAVSDKVKAGQHLSKADHEAWHAALAERGWLAIHWPVQYGGTGWGPVERYIFDEEANAAGAPQIIPFGVSMVAPVIIKFGTEEQKQRYLPRILDGSDWWCQGYSEPGAGSDLASVRTKAVRDGDHYVVNGQKTWTTLGQHANMIFCLVRTDPQAKPQEGISFLLVDMETPGVTVRPIITLDGAHEVNEVFFDDVRVPVENLVGRENKGWDCAKYLLTYERTGIAGIGMAKAALSHLKDVATKQTVNGRPLMDDPLFRSRVAEVEIELMAAEMTNLRIVAAVQGGGVPGAESSLLKVKGTEIRQAITDLLRRAVGPHALPFMPEALDADWNGEPVGPAHAAPLAGQYFNRRKLSIYGGSNEIQKNIVAKMILGL